MNNPKFQIVKDATIAYLVEGGWHPDDAPLQSVKSADTWDDLCDGIYQAARHIGDNKGWGDEGVGDLQGEMIEAIGKKCDVDIDLELETEFQITFQEYTKTLPKN